VGERTNSSGIGPLRRYLLVAVAVLVGGVSVGAGLRMLRARRIVLREGPNRAACQHNLWLIGQAISKYVDTTGSAPPSLDALVDCGLLEAWRLCCPTALAFGTEAECRYAYLPQNLGDSEQAMVTEAATNHDLAPRFRRWEMALSVAAPSPVQHAVAGDGALGELREGRLRRFGRSR
jgi:hypothetical protein